MKISKINDILNGKLFLLLGIIFLTGGCLNNNNKSGTYKRNKLPKPYYFLTKQDIDDKYKHPKFSLYKTINKKITNLKFSPGYKYLVTYSNYKDINILKFPSFKLIKHIPFNQTIRALGFSSDSRYFVYSSFKKTMVFDLNKKKNINSFKTNGCSFAFSPNGKFFAISGDGYGPIKLANLEKNNLNTIKDSHFTKINKTKIGKVRPGHIVYEIIKFSTDSKFLISGSTDFFIKIWNVKTKKLTLIKAHNNDIYSFSFSPNGKNIASVSNKIKIWDIHSKRLIKSFGYQKNS
jgi:WD40 repeat protein